MRLCPDPGIFIPFIFDQLILKEKEQEIYPVSVIIDDINDEYYANFRTGMDMAAENYHVDVNFITLYADNDQEQQLELLRREVRDGARAVVLAPVNESSAVMALEELPSDARSCCWGLPPETARLPVPFLRICRRWENSWPGRSF